MQDPPKDVGKDTDVNFLKDQKICLRYMYGLSHSRPSSKAAIHIQISQAHLSPRTNISQFLYLTQIMKCLLEVGFDPAAEQSVQNSGKSESFSLAGLIVSLQQEIASKGKTAFFHIPEEIQACLVNSSLPE